MKTLIDNSLIKKPKSGLADTASFGLAVRCVPVCGSKRPLDASALPGVPRPHPSRQVVMRTRIAILVLSSIATLMAGEACAAVLQVRLVLSDSSTPYGQFARAFNEALVAAKADVNVVETHSAGGDHVDLVVAVGMKATELAVSQADAPVLAAMVPEAGYRKLLAGDLRQAPVRALSAIYLNQSWERQLDFLRAALPGRRRIGLLYSPNTGLDVEGLGQRVAKRGGLLVERPVPAAEKLFSSLEGLLEDSDLLLAIPDSAIYNGSTIRNILLTSYRRGIPLVGWSQPYVNAGALCAVFSTAEQIAQQTGATVSQYARTRRLPDSQYPDDFTIAVNEQVARSLGIELPSEENIYRRMGKAQNDKPRGREK